jgi:hypothetical protein
MNTLKIGAPGIHRGKSLRLYIRGNQETSHGQREVHFLSQVMAMNVPLLCPKMFGEAILEQGILAPKITKVWCTLPVDSMLRAYRAFDDEHRPGPVEPDSAQNHG